MPKPDDFCLEAQIGIGYFARRSGYLAFAPDCRPRQAEPHAQMATVGLLDVERAGLADEIAELAVAVGTRVEVRKQIGRCAGRPGRAITQPSSAADSRRRLSRIGIATRRLHRALCRKPPSRRKRHGCAGQQVLGVAEAAARLTKTLRRRCELQTRRHRRSARARRDSESRVSRVGGGRGKTCRTVRCAKDPSHR